VAINRAPFCYPLYSGSVRTEVWPILWVGNSRSRICLGYSHLNALAALEGGLFCLKHDQKLTTKDRLAVVLLLG
jgi:hypothetical protein